MKKYISFIICVLLLCTLITPVLAAPEGPVITLQPQSPNYPEYSVAEYTVKATGSNLTASWYMEWEGKTYNISDYTNGYEPWEDYAGETYGAEKLDANTFRFSFWGIEHPLNGATIWCVIEDGHYSVTSQKAYINMGNPATPPTIVDIPAQITVEQGQKAKIYCNARSNDGTELGYIWYETSTGDLRDIQALDRGTEIGDTLSCDTSKVGTRYYVCAVNTSQGGMCYSSVVPVTVTPKASVAEPQILTDTLPEAVAGETYSAKLQCSDPKAEFSVYYNPGKGNDFEATGLTLTKDGKITGTPKAAGEYEFCVCASGEGGEDYRVYTLRVQEAAPQEPATTEPPVTEEPTVQETPQDTPIPPEASSNLPTTQDPDKEDAEIIFVEKKDRPGETPWWLFLLIGVGGAGIGVAVAVLIVKKKA